MYADAIFGICLLLAFSAPPLADDSAPSTACESAACFRGQSPDLLAPRTVLSGATGTAAPDTLDPPLGEREVRVTPDNDLLVEDPLLEIRTMWRQLPHEQPPPRESNPAPVLIPPKKPQSGFDGMLLAI